VRKAVLASVILFACGVLIGIAFPGAIARMIGPAILKMVERAGALLNNTVMLLFIFMKNFQVALLLLCAGLLRRSGKQDAAGWRKLLAACENLLLVLYSGLLLTLNGTMLSWVTVLLYKAGVPAAALAGGLLPHGVIEIPALIMCGGYALAGRAGVKEGRDFFFYLRVVVPMLVLAAVVAVYVSRVLIQKLL